MNLENFITSNDKDFGLLTQKDISELSPEELTDVSENLKETYTHILDYINQHKLVAFSVLAGFIGALITKLTNEPDSSLVVGAGVGAFIAASAKISKFLEGRQEKA